MPRFEWIKKVLVLGSGAIKIGEAAEFDYSGSQCLKALREEGIETILVNPNIATIQTDPSFGGKVYLLPVNPEYVEEVIKKERPDALLLSFGGQTALNCGVLLAKKGILEKYNVKVIGTPIQTIEETEDRFLFKKAMDKANVPVPMSEHATSVGEALSVGDKIGYPVIVRVAYTLGGKGSGVAYSRRELEEIVRVALAQSMINEVLIEEYLHHWKEVEYEVMRDYAGNCITVCNMENFDPMGVHTGDSIVIAPSQTLTNREYHILRSTSIRAVKSLGIVGECNIQFALNPRSEEFRAIEINARMSRSSALASKATGYPLAYIAAKLAIGYTLPELINRVTGITTSAFEPSLDYVVVKIPRWDLQKFRNVDRRLGPQMKSVGEVMAVGRCFEEALQKAIRMLDLKEEGFSAIDHEEAISSSEVLKQSLDRPTDKRIFQLYTAIKTGISIEELYKITGIDSWFLAKMKNIVDMEIRLASTGLSDPKSIEIIREAKRLGFSDRQIASILQVEEDDVRLWRKNNRIIPVVKQIDTLAAEWPAKTNYLYVTYGGEEDDVRFSSNREKVIVLGSGVFRIGSSVEFDWCSVNAILSLKKKNVESIIINYNPETVSTDYDIPDKLYFEELTLERVLDICEKENPDSVIVSVGGQIPNSMALNLSERGIKILGTRAENIDRAEDRAKFSALLDRLKIPQPQWSKFEKVDDARKFAKQIRYPVLIRPSYVLSGSAMRIAYTEQDLKVSLQLAAKVSPEHPVVVSKFIENAREVEADGVRDGTDTLTIITEHLENAGVHSGDAVMVTPPQSLSTNVLMAIQDYTKKIADALDVVGPINIQYLVKDDMIYVIECNLRASRSMPFVSKTYGINMIDLAVNSMLGKKFENLGLARVNPIWHVGVKVPQFSFMRLTGADPVLGVEMLSTGEVACLGSDFVDAFLKALEASEFKIPSKKAGVLLASQNSDSKITQIATRFMNLGFKLYAIKESANTFNGTDVRDPVILDPHTKRGLQEIRNHIQNGNIGLVISGPSQNTTNSYDIEKDGYAIRRLAVEYNLPLVPTSELAWALANGLERRARTPSTIVSLNDYSYTQKEVPA